MLKMLRELKSNVDYDVNIEAMTSDDVVGKDEFQEIRFCDSYWGRIDE